MSWSWGDVSARKVYENCKKPGPAVGTDNPSTGRLENPSGSPGAGLTRYLRDSPAQCAHVQVSEHMRLVFVLPRSPPCPPPSSPQLQLSQVSSELAAPFSTLIQVSLLGVPTGFCSFPLNYFLVAFPVSHNPVCFNTAL